MFNTTVFENIRYGDADLPEQHSEEHLYEQVIEVAKKANAHDFIMALPLQYQTQVGQKGLQLSGGQRQRIAIARALFKNPRILLLDEATSALDLKSEAAIQCALDAAAEHRTTIVVAHRLSTIRNADKIVVMSNGNVVEEGLHDELIARKGFYASMVQKQQIDDTHQATDIDVDKAEDLRMETRQEVAESMSYGEKETSGVDSKEVLAPSTQIDEQKRLSLARTLVFIDRMNRRERVLLVFGLACAITAGFGIPVLVDTQLPEQRFSFR